MRIFATLFILTLSLNTFAQNISKMWRAKDYEGIYEQMPRVNRMASMDMLHLANSAFRLGHDSEAVYVLDLSIKKGYATDQHYYAKGDILHSQHIYIDAAEAYHQALALNPHRLPYMLAKADAYYLGRQPDSALAVFRRVHVLFPDKDVATFMECKIQAEEGYIESAVTCYKEHIPQLVALEYKVAATEEIVNLLWYGMNDTTHAAKYINSLIRMQPDVIKHRLSAIQIRAELDQWDKVEVQRAFLREKFESGTMPAFYTKKNALPLLDVEGNNYRLQFFENLETRPNSAVFKSKWNCFMATPQHGVLAGTWKYVENEGDIHIESTAEGVENIALEEPMSFQDFVIYMIDIESKM